MSDFIRDSYDILNFLVGKNPEKPIFRMYKNVISVLGSVVFLGIYLIWNQQAWTSQVKELELENQRLIEEIEILKVRPPETIDRTCVCPRSQKLEFRHGNRFCVLMIIYLFRRRNLDLGKKMRNIRWKLEDYQKKRP